jgi:hypothetical protein
MMMTTIDYRTNGQRMGLTSFNPSIDIDGIMYPGDTSHQRDIAIFEKLLSKRINVAVLSICPVAGNRLRMMGLVDVIHSQIGISKRTIRNRFFELSRKGIISVNESGVTWWPMGWEYRRVAQAFENMRLDIQ